MFGDIYSRRAAGRCHCGIANAAWADDYNTERPHSSLGYQTRAVHAAGLMLAASRPVDSVAETATTTVGLWARVMKAGGQP